MKQPAKSNSNIFPVSFTATRFESRIIFKGTCYINSEVPVGLHYTVTLISFKEIQIFVY